MWVPRATDDIMFGALVGAEFELGSMGQLLFLCRGKNKQKAPASKENGGLFTFDSQILYRSGCISSGFSLQTA